MAQSIAEGQKNASFESASLSSEGVLPRGPIYFAPPVVPEDDGIDLFDASFKLLRGWKLIALVMFAAGLVAAIYFVRASGQFVARTTVSPQISVFTPAPNGNSPSVLPGTVKIDPVVMRTYLAAFRSGAPLGEDRGIAVSVQQAKDLPEIEVAAVADDPDAARLALEESVAAGLTSVETVRQKTIRAVRQELQERRDNALKDLEEKQKRYQEVRRSSNLGRKKAELQVLPGQAMSAQRAMLDRQADVRMLESRLEAAREMLKNTQHSRREKHRLADLPEFCTELASKLNVPPISLLALQVDLEQPNEVFDWLEQSIAQDQVALRGMASAVQQYQESYQATLQQIDALQSEVDQREADLTLLQRDLEEARSLYFAVEDAVSQSREDFDRAHPPLALAEGIEPSVGPVAGRSITKLILGLAGAFILGCAVVLVRAAYVERMAAQRPAGNNTIPIPPCAEPPLPQRVPA
jgi:hypothetical protein